MFSESFYVTIATVIPVLWLTVGFATATQTVVKTFHMVHKLMRFQPQMFRHRLNAYSELMMHWGLPVSRRTRLRLQLTSAWVPLISFSSAVFNPSVGAITFVLTGLTAECLSLWALYSHPTSRALEMVVLILSMIIMVMTAFVLSIGLFTATRREKEMLTDQDLIAADVMAALLESQHLLLQARKDAKETMNRRHKAGGRPEPSTDRISAVAKQLERATSKLQDVEALIPECSESDSRWQIGNFITELVPSMMAADLAFVYPHDPGNPKVTQVEWEPVAAGASSLAETARRIYGASPSGSPDET
jgi:hypothetical protein